jgi:hypothetical protein
MSLWWRSSQCVYSHPRIAATGAALLLLGVGAGGWESARRITPANAPEPVAGGSHNVVAGAQMIRVEAEADAVTHVVQRTRTVTTPGRTRTVVVRRRVVRTVVPAVGSSDANPVARERIRTVIEPRVVTRTVHDKQTEQAPPARTVPTRTITVTEVVTQTVTQPPLTVTTTLTVTTNPGTGH